jgi:sulfur carrier protein
MRMKILLNGIEHDIEAPASLAQLLEATGYATRRVAVEVNREIVPRSRYPLHPLAAGDRVEIVHAIGGG